VAMRARVEDVRGAGCAARVFRECAGKPGAAAPPRLSA
jgi:hypothetical protein